MFIYGMGLATPGNTTTSGSANTEVGTFSMKPGSSRRAVLQAIYIQGKDAGATAITGLFNRLAAFATASTGGTGVTPSKRDNDNPAANTAVLSGQTLGSTRTNHGGFGCGRAGPGGWVAPNPDSPLSLDAGSAASLDAINVSAGTSITFEWGAELQE